MEECVPFKFVSVIPWI